MVNSEYGHWAFILGVIIAIIAGLATGAMVLDANTTSWTTAILVILGIIVGFLNISEKETQSFLITTIALMLVGTSLFYLNPLFNLGSILTAIMRYVLAFIAPAALIVALKAMYKLSARSSSK